MGRGRKARTAAPSVIGPTPQTEDQPFGLAGIQARQAAQDELMGVVGDGGAGGGALRGSSRAPATMRVGAFFAAPPRTELLASEGPDVPDGGAAAGERFKKSAAAPVTNLGQLSGMIWGRTSASRGGARDPASGPAAAAARILEGRAELDEGGPKAALMSADGFKAYADATIWGVRAPGEADDAPLDTGDAIQVKDRLREVWARWRSLSPEQQRLWADKQLTHDAAVAVKRATSGKAAPPKSAVAAGASRPLGGSIWSGAADSAVGGGASKKKPDGWAYSRGPSHAARHSKLPAAELEQLKQEQAAAEEEAGKEEEEQAHRGTRRSARGASSSAAAAAGAGSSKRARGGGSKKADDDDDDVAPQQDGGAAAASRERQLGEELNEARWRRAVALRRSKPALLAEMAVWEDEAEAAEAAAAAGISVEELRLQRAAAAEQAAADEAAAALAAREQEDAAEQQGNEEEAPAPGAGAAAGRGAARSKGRASKAAAAAAAAGSSRGRRRAASKAEPEEPADLSGDEEEDEDAPGPEEEAELARALSDGDDSDADGSDDGSEEEAASEEEEKEEAAPPAKKPKAAAGKALRGASSGKRRAAAAADGAGPSARKRARKQAQPSSTAPAAAGRQLRQQAAGTLRRSQRQSGAQDEAGDGPAASGAGPSSAPRHMPGTAQAAQIERAEKDLFSNTGRRSRGHGTPQPTGPKRSSRLVGGKQ